MAVVVAYRCFRTSNNYHCTTARSALRQRMLESSTVLVAISSVCIVMSYFGTYVIKYPLFVVDYDGGGGEQQQPFGGEIGLKDYFSYALTFGFFLGKFPSYALVPSVTREQRLPVLFLLFAVASIFITGLLPFQGHGEHSSTVAAVQILAILIGSIFCSAIFGVQLTYLEGRSNGDLLLAALNCVVLFGSSLCRAGGTLIIQSEIVPGRWMPLLAAGIYAPVVVLTLLGLDAMPDPNEDDRRSRGARTTMTREEKTAFLTEHGSAGLFPLLCGYAFLAGFRFLRDFYALEVYREVLAREPAPADYILADWVGGFLSVAALLAMSRVDDNTRALMALHGMFAGGGALIGLGTFMFQRGRMPPEFWIAAVGAGVSISSTPFTGSLFDRIVASTRTRGTAVFLVYFADGVAYVGVLALLLYKTTRPSDTTYSELFLRGCHVFTGVLILTGAISAMYWRLVAKRVQDGERDSVVYGALDPVDGADAFAADTTARVITLVPSLNIELKHKQQREGIS